MPPFINRRRFLELAGCTGAGLGMLSALGTVSVLRGAPKTPSALGALDQTLSSFRPSADLPPLLRFLDGSPVLSIDDFHRRQAEIRTLFTRYFIGTFPLETPDLLHADITSTTRSNDGSQRLRIRLRFDTPGQKSFEIHLWIPTGNGPFPLLLTQPRDYQIPWAELALNRGYMVCLYPGVDSHHHEPDYPDYNSVWETFRSEYPEATWTEISTKAWLASRSLDYLLDRPHEYKINPAHIGIIGHSRYGKQSLIASAFDERITAVLARSPGSPASSPYRFTSRNTFAETPEDFPSEWFLPSLRSFTGREHELPVDAHGWYALVAPRHCLIHTAHNDGSEPTFAVERSFMEGQTVYDFLGHPQNLRLHYRTGAHGPITPEHREHNIDWFDLVFQRGSISSSAFPETCLHRFDWHTWKETQPPDSLIHSFSNPHPPRNRQAILQRIHWMLGHPPGEIEWNGRRDFLTPEESQMMTHDRWAPQGVARRPVSFGENVRGNVYFNPEFEGPRPVVVWLHPYSYHSGYNEGYGVQDTTVYHRLAQQGYIVLAFDQLGFGLRLLEGTRFYRQYPTWSRLGRMIHDVRRAVDFIVDGDGAFAPTDDQAAPPEFDPNTIIALGYSMGGMVALYAAALDERITSVASFSGFTPMRTDTDDSSTGGIRRFWQWHALLPKLGLFHGNEQNIPYDYHDLIALVAPRPALLVAPTHDRDNTLDDIKHCVASATNAWSDQPDRFGLSFLTPEGFNAFQADQQQRFINWLQTWIPGQSSRP